VSKVLFVTSEAYPLIKTGGLGDVCGSLPLALQSLDCDVRLLMPGYRDALAAAGNLETVAELATTPGGARINLIEGYLPGTRVPVWFVDFPPAYGRPGNPYLDHHGVPWTDNAARFALLARVASAIALGQAPLRWQPDVVHCHDWQTGLVPALLAQAPARPATVFTIHNLAYQGLFPHHLLAALGLPASWWSYDALEFHGQLSFIKGGIVYADWITTVSPTYAREIQTPAFGDGLDGLLRHRAQRLLGILNGIDTGIWNPARDAHVVAHYSAKRLAPKADNKAALQRELRLAPRADAPLIGMVGRMVHQKGADLLTAALPRLMQLGAQLAILGSGDAALERALRAATAEHPGECAALIGYDETLAHRIFAGADAFLMPSRFEPCGLSQLYALRYGAVPIVHRVGGLADTVVDANPAALESGTATGVVFESANALALGDAVARAVTLYRQPRTWKQLIATGMRQDYSWRHSAQDYARLYRRATGKSHT
jgi:starch synthase